MSSRTVRALPANDVAPLAERLDRNEIHVITFTSSSTVRNFVRLFGDKDLGAIVADSAIACIGPITARTVEESGGHPAIVAEEFTIPGMVQAIVAYFASRSEARAGFPASGQTKLGACHELSNLPAEAAAA